MVALGERSTPNGQELLAEFIQYGHQKPFEEIVRRYAGMVFNVCYRITKDKHEAEDATQAVFLTLALQAKRGADIKALGPWLQQVGKRLALDTRRSKKRRLNREERHHTEQTIRRESLLDDALPSADLDELKTILHEELQKLPAKYRMPLILHYFGGLSRDEMAAELNCKASTLGVRIFRGREMLAGRLSSRGIHISTSMLAVLLGYAVKRAVSESLIASTSHAATAMMAGYDGAGYASAHVIGLTRRAGSAMALGKVKMAAITLILAGTSLGAGAKALGIIPPIAQVKQMISNQLMRMVSPLVNPFSQPILRVDSTITPTQAPTAPTPVVDARPLNIIKPIVTANPQVTVSQTPGLATNTASSGIVINLSAAPSRSALTDPLASANHNLESKTPVLSTPVERSSGGSASTGIDVASTVAASASPAGGGGGAAGGIDAPYHQSNPLPSKAPPQSSFAVSDLAFSTQDIYVGAATGLASSSNHLTSNNSTDPIATPAALVQIPATNGTVTDSSTGVLRGWGTIARSGTLVNHGEVVADGQGYDRTLNLSSMSLGQGAVSSSSPNGGTSASNTLASNTLASNTLASNTPISTAPASSPPVSAAGSAALGMSMVSAADMGSSTAFANAAVIGTAPPAMAPSAGVVNDVISASSPTVCHTDGRQADGWYAINHGRLIFRLDSSSTDPSVLTWGDPGGGSLTLVNSVRIHMNTTDPAPASLALLATDRSDVPSLLQISGDPIGLWEVDPNGPALASADLSILYNSTLADELGASPSSIELWTYGNAAGDWQQVDPSSFALDTTDHIVSGSADDINFFAVSVQATIGGNVNDLLANHLAQTSGAGDSHSVPEPTAMSLLIAGGAALLGRRRRKIAR